MKVIIISAAAVLALASAALSPPAAPDSYRDLSDVDALAGSSEKVLVFLDCFTNKGPCSDEAGYLKSIAPDFLGNACSKCTETQKVQIKTILIAAYKYYPEITKVIKGQLDPEGRLFPALHAVIGISEV